MLQKKRACSAIIPGNWRKKNNELYLINNNFKPHPYYTLPILFTHNLFLSDKLQLSIVKYEEH